ncbi:MAG: hypothetical protein P4L85_02925 [Paludisphaera borealis]|uniref:hypothetical protein n=1 Tax=Paludisphaera borealis TaxID=1387353 RepID=UPI0028405F7D|nr:hypothetical protein [Paludisphaera borealis]MDR3618276.1 hypothetical protein [Paludisphaera borealis]
MDRPFDLLATRSPASINSLTASMTVCRLRPDWRAIVRVLGYPQSVPKSENSPITR